MRRRDRVREAIVLAQENLYGENQARALRFARRAVRLDRGNPEAHSVLAACLDDVQRYEEGLVHHRRAEHLQTRDHSKAVWRLHNALAAVQACMQLRNEAPESEAQSFWDEAAAWARLAYLIDPHETQETLSMDPWLIPFASGGQEWLRA